MNRRPIVIATVIGALGGAMAVIIFLYFFNIVKMALLLSDHRSPQPASMEIDLSPDGEWFLEQRDQIETRLDVLTMRELKMRGLNDEVYHDNMAVGPDGAIAIAEQDNSIYLIDFTEGATIRTLKGHTDSVIRMSFSPDESTLLSGSMDETIRLWDVKTGVCKQTVPINGTLPDE